MILKTRMPVVSMGEGKLAAIMGTPTVELGAVVTVRDLSAMETHRDMFVRDSLVYEIKDLPDDVLNAFGFKTFSDFRMDITNRIRMGIPAEAQVTIVVMGDQDAIINPEPEEVEEAYTDVEDLMSDDDILPLVFPIPEDEEVEANSDEDED